MLVKMLYRAYNRIIQNNTHTDWRQDMWTVRYTIKGQLDETDTFDTEKKATAMYNSLKELGIFDTVEIRKK